MFSKNWKFATKNKSGTAQIDDIGDMRATSKRAAAVSTPAKRTRASGRVTVANVDVWHLYRCNGMYDPQKLP